MYKLSDQEKRAWEATCTVLGAAAPGFTHLWHTLLVNHDQEYYAIMDPKIPTAATDERNIKVNPKAFFKQSIRQRVYILIHEILHNVYHDCQLLRTLLKAGKVVYSDGTELPFINDLFQQAGDYRINAAIEAAHYGERPTAPYNTLFDLRIASANEGILEVYRKLFDKTFPKGAPSPGDVEGNPRGMDCVLIPGETTGESPEDVAASANSDKWRTEIATALRIEQQRGRLPAGIERAFDEFLHPKVSWEDHLQGYVARRWGIGGWSWEQPDYLALDRDLYECGRSGHGLGWLVGWGDTSGSMSPPQLTMALNHLVVIFRDLNPKRFTLIWGDAAVGRVDEFTSLEDVVIAYKRGAPGGGGTSCVPIFREIEKMMQDGVPDAFVGFTDADATFPTKPPPYPCIWVVDNNHHTPPWGEVIRMNP